MKVTRQTSPLKPSQTSVERIRQMVSFNFEQFRVEADDENDVTCTFVLKGKITIARTLR